MTPPAGAVSVFGGVKILELAQWVFVPAAGALLSDWGADVVKIEAVDGDPYRGLETQGLTSSMDGLNYSVEMANRGKRSIGLDIKSPAGRQLLYRLVAESDVFLTNFRPAALDRLGLGVDELRKHNPRLIYARGHGFGVRGPDRDVPAYDATAFWSRGGMAHVLTPEGSDYPLQQRGAFGDRQAAMNLAFGVAGALFRRASSGEASVVDVSLLASAMWTLTADVLRALQGQQPRSHTSRTRLANPLVNFFRTQDGRYLDLVLLQPDRYWAELCGLLDRPELADDARFVDIATRAENRGECLKALDEAFALRPYAEWVERFSASNLPWAPVQAIEEVLADPQVIANGYISAVETGETGDERPLNLPSGPVQFDERPPTLRRAPEHGANTEELLLELGLSWDEITALKDQNAIM